MAILFSFCTFAFCGSGGEVQLGDLDKALLTSPNDRDALYKRGLWHLKKKNYIEASLDFKEILKQAPSDPDTLNNMGICSYFLGKKREALNLYSRAFSLKSDSFKFLKNYLNASIVLGELKMALLFIQNHEKNFPSKEKELLSIKVRIYRHLGDYGRLKMLYKEYLNKHPEDLDKVWDYVQFLLSLKNEKDSYPWVDKLLAANYNGAPPYHYILASLLLRKGEYEKCVDLLKGKVVSRKEGNETEQILLFQVLVHLKLWDEALLVWNLMQPLSKIDKDYFSILVGAQSMFKHLKLDKDLELLLKEAVELFPDSKKVVFLWADYLIGENREVEALSTLERLKTIRHSGFDVDRKVLELYLFLEKWDDFQGLLHKLSAKFKKNQAPGWFLYARGMESVHFDNLNEGLDYFTRSLKVAPAYSPARVMRAKLLSGFGQFSEAYDEYKVLTEKNAENSEYWKAFAEVAFKLKYIEESRLYYSRAKALEPELPDYEYFFSEFQSL